MGWYVCVVEYMITLTQVQICTCAWHKCTRYVYMYTYVQTYVFITHKHMYAHIDTHFHTYVHYWSWNIRLFFNYATIFSWWSGAPSSLAQPGELRGLRPVTQKLLQALFAVAIWPANEGSSGAVVAGMAKVFLAKQKSSTKSILAGVTFFDHRSSTSVRLCFNFATEGSKARLTIAN